MKNFSLVLILATFTSFSFAQDIETFGKKDTSKTFILGGYGEPFAGAGTLNDDWGIMVGVKGGMLFNRKFGFGPIAKVNIGLWEFQGNNLNFNDSANLELYMGSVGLFLEYHFKMQKKIHFSIPVNIMVGGVGINEDLGGMEEFETKDEGFGKENSSRNEVESGGIFVVEPEINIDFNVAKFFIPNLKIGYRAVFGSQLVNVTDADLSGVYFGIGLKFGKF